MMDSCAAPAAANSISKVEIILSSVLRNTIQAQTKKINAKLKKKKEVKFHSAIFFHLLNCIWTLVNFSKAVF